MPNVLQKKGCQLRQLQSDNLPSVLTLLAIPGLAKTAGLQLPAENALREWAINNWLSHHYLWGIFQQRQLIGLLALFPVSENSCELGYLMDSTFRRQGIMTAAVHELLTSIHSTEIIAETIMDNYASIAILQANGFVKKAGNNDNYWHWYYRG